MARAKNGDTVKVHYTGKFKDGSVFDTSRERDPLQFTIGANQIIRGFEKAVVGMSPGEAKTTEVPADEAYGPHHPEMVLEVSQNKIPEHIKPEVGQQLQIRQGDKAPVLVKVTEVTESSVTLDANHPLAGKDLIFDLQLVEIL